MNDKIEHDDQCERMLNFFLCHCAKRERLARGMVELPLMSVQYPICHGCWKEVWHDGESYRCDNCHVTWDTNAGDGDRAENFTDDYDWTDRDGAIHTLDDQVKAWLNRGVTS